MTATNHLPSSANSPSTEPVSLTRRSVLRAGAAGGLFAASGAAALLSGCGSGDIVSALQPARFIAFGDGMSDLGQGGARYTVNDGTVNIWAERVANRYGKTLTAQAVGGLGYAQGHAATDDMPRSMAAQIDAFLSANTIGTSDVVLMNIPLSYVLRPVAAVKAGTLTQTAALQQIADSAVALSSQVKRLIASGAKYIVVAGAYDVGRSPYGIAMELPSMLTSETQRSSAAVTHLNDRFKIEVATLGANVLFVDAAFLVNRNVQFGPNWGFVNSNKALCTTPTALTCTDSTLTAGATKSQYLFADNIHLTPAGNQQLGDYAYDQLRGRW
ncbi:MAG TPA: SGNH/GDSL hydrolase family protein [Burkholderiaceae bacterium]|nr:SGNH/GDSL hydrolase family protein [Burkholderiaceae bacterium]